jgi:hypothetical protein
LNTGDDHSTPENSSYRATSPGEQHLVVSDAIFEVIHKGVATTPRRARRGVH